MNLTSPGDIKSFVRHTLGCGCDESVFSRVESQAGVRLGDDLTLAWRVVVGARLLVFVVEFEDSIGLSKGLPLVVQHGRAERDALGLSRMRIVVAGRDAVSLRDAAERVFASHPAVDERMHLHCLTGDESI